MKLVIDLHKLDVLEWPCSFDLQSLQPSSKLLSFLEVHGPVGSDHKALSPHCIYLATTILWENLFCLFVVDFRKKRCCRLKRFTYEITCLEFHPDDDDILIVATSASDVVVLSLGTQASWQLTGHSQAVKGIYVGDSGLLLSYSHNEAVIWDWKSSSMISRLTVEKSSSIVWACYFSEKGQAAAGFDCGTVIVWDKDKTMSGKNSLPTFSQSSNQNVIVVPEGITMDFHGFIYSSDWLVAYGSQALLVIYSLLSFKVIQVIQLPSSSKGIQQASFLPNIHPKYPLAVLMKTMAGTLILVDFSSMEKLKTLKSQKHKIENFCISRDGFLVGVGYNNSTTKLYTLLSLFPSLPSKLEESEVAKEKHLDMKDVEFRIVEGAACPQDCVALNYSRDRPKQHANLEAILDKNRWVKVLKEFGEFPRKYRPVIWASMLELPKNYSIVSSLLAKGIHHDCTHFDQLRNLDPELLSTMKSTLSCLLFWCPRLTEACFLPELIFPFVKYFKSNAVLAFEVSATVLYNWCSLWWEYLPNPPVAVLNCIENSISKKAEKLLEHLCELNLTAYHYAWPLLSSAFSKVFSKDDWLVVWDHIICNKPYFMMHICVAFVISLQPTILSSHNLDSIIALFQQETWIPVENIIKEAYKLESSYPFDPQVSEKLSQFVPLPLGGLPALYIGPQPAKGKGQMVNPSKYTQPEKEDMSPYSEEAKLLSEDFCRREAECFRKIHELRRKQASERGRSYLKL